MSRAPTFEAGFTVIDLMIFTIATLALFLGVGARGVEIHSIVGIVRLASIEGGTSVIGTISLVLVPIAALALISVVERRMWRSAGCGTFTIAASLWGTALFIYSSFTFFVVAENEIGKSWL